MTALPRWVSLLFLISVMANPGCSKKNSKQEEKNEDSSVSTTENSEKKLLPQRKLSKHPTLRIPRVTAGKIEPLKGPMKHVLVITGTVAQLNHASPVEWRCESPKCTLKQAREELALPEETPIQVAFTPEVSAMGVTAWLLELSNQTDFIVAGKAGTSEEMGSIHLKPGRILPFLFYPGSMKYSLETPLKPKGRNGEKSESEEAPKAAVSVRGGKLEIAESCMDKLINRTTRRHLRHFVACYRAYSEHPNPAEGELIVGWDVPQNGKTVNPRISSKDIVDKTLNTCLTAAIATVPYVPSPTRGPNCSVDWTLRFKQRDVPQKTPEKDAPVKDKISQTVIASIGEKIVTFSFASGGSKEIISLTKAGELFKKIKSYEKIKPTFMITYAGQVTAQTIMEVAAIAAEVGLQDIRLAHPRK